jgi:hypothetical protein
MVHWQSISNLSALIALQIFDVIHESVGSVLHILQQF